MKNLDAIKNAKAKFAQNLKTAIDSKDEAKMTEALNAYADSIQQSIIEVAQEIGETADNTILAKRGFRQLTSAEQKFYNNFVTAAKSADVKQALTGLDVVVSVFHFLFTTFQCVFRCLIIFRNIIFVCPFFGAREHIAIFLSFRRS